MGFHERIKTSQSRAEIDLYIALLNKGYLVKYQVPIPLDYEVDKVHGTIADIQINKLLIFLDGGWMKGSYPHGHLKPRQQQKDELITGALEKRGYKVLRIPYNGRRPSKKLLKEWVEQVSCGLT